MVPAALAVMAVGACASIAGSNSTTVQFSTNPAGGHCDLRGTAGYAASVDTPASLDVPTSAAPVIVTCTAQGRRPTTYSLDASANGWRWGNSALIVVTGGAAVLGLLVDESRNAGMSYVDAVRYDLDPDRPRTIVARDRTGGETLTLQTR